MKRKKLIDAAVEIIAGSMEYNGTPDGEIYAEAEALTDEELKAFLAEV